MTMLLTLLAPHRSALDLVIVLGAVLVFFIKYTRHPQAGYGIGAAGLLEVWLGLGLASRW
jgi:hypothetical protein